MRADRSRPFPQPRPYDRDGYRYTKDDFPPYRHLPGVTPHPRRHPEGHLYAEPELPAPVFDSAAWESSLDYFYGIDLYNFAYYWEAHEAWEGIWKTTARTDLTGAYLQGLIQIAAAFIKREQRIEPGMKRLSRSGLAKLKRVVSVEQAYCGVDLREYVGRLELIFEERNLSGWPADPRIRLRDLEPISGRISSNP